MAPGTNARQQDFLRRYDEVVRQTNRLESSTLTPILLGVIGEVGSITTVAKKLYREDRAYPAYLEDAIEEFGDALWYLTSLGQRVGIPLYENRVLLETNSPNSNGPIFDTSSRDSSLLKLAHAAGQLVSTSSDISATRLLFLDLVDAYVQAVRATKLDLEHIVLRNIEKTSSRFLDPLPGELPEFDSASAEDESIPKQMTIVIRERSDGRAWMQLDGVFIGDALTDNIADNDGYRFHDVFHFSYAAYLNWSPVIRALLKRKRKSDRNVDENEDGGRAIVVEEGISAFVFARAKELRYFDGFTTVGYDVLKTIQQFVKGYEIEACPLRQWERAILAGFEVFRQLKLEKQGTIDVDLVDRTISFRPLRPPV